MDDRIRWGVALLCGAGILGLIWLAGGRDTNDFASLAAILGVFGLGFVALGLLRGEP